MLRRYLQSIPTITDAHHLHIWALSTTETALTVHLVKPDPLDDDGVLRRINQELTERFPMGMRRFSSSAKICGNADLDATSLTIRKKSLRWRRTVCNILACWRLLMEPDTDQSVRVDLGACRQRSPVAAHKY